MTAAAAKRVEDRGVGVGVEAGEPHPRDRQTRRDVAQHGLDLVGDRAARDRVVARDDPGLEHVHVERDVDRVGAGERAVEIVVDAVLGDVRLLGRVEVAGADERDVGRPDASFVDRHPQRHAPGVAGRRRLGRVEVAVRVQPDDGESVVTRGEPADRADVGAAAAAQHERAVRQTAGDRVGLLRQRLALDDERLRIREGEERGVGHRLAAHAPRARDAHEPRRERCAAAVALVLVVERDGGQRPAVRTACSERAQDALSQMSHRQRTRIPARS